MFVVYSVDCGDPIEAICTTRADAEAFIYDLCLEWAYEYLMTTDDPMFKNWDSYDVKWLMNDCAQGLAIQEVSTII